MKVFISWSGQQSFAVARALYDWLPETIQAVKPWMSFADIQAGARWTPEINQELSQTKFGIICLTRENQNAPWVLFEAGALAKTIEDTRVVPYLIDIDKSDITGPLAQFQATRMLGREGTLELVKSLNEAVRKSGEDALAEKALTTVFNRGWSDLDAAFKAIPEPESPISHRRDPDDILREILDLVRGLSNQASHSLRVGVADSPIERFLLEASQDRPTSIFSADDRRRTERQLERFQEVMNETLHELAMEERESMDEDDVDPSAEMDAER